MPPKPVIAVTLNSAELPRMVHWRQMFDGLQECGAIAVAIDCGTAGLDVAGLIGHADGLLLSGGGDVEPTRYGGDPTDPTLSWVNPMRDFNEIAAFAAAWERNLPTLAICRGAQLANVSRGGTLYADLVRDFGVGVDHRPGEEALLGLAHPVRLAENSRLAEWTGKWGTIHVNSQHHQGIRTLADEFTVSARSPDGLIEAFESVDRPFTAIQFHPEMNWSVDAFARALLLGFVSSCATQARL